MRGKGVNTMRNCKMKLGYNSKAICTYEAGKMEADVSIWDQCNDWLNQSKVSYIYILCNYNSLLVVSKLNLSHICAFLF